MRLAGRGQCLVPLHDTLRQRLHLARGDLLGEAGEQHAAADRCGLSLPAIVLLLDRHAEVEAELEQQLEEDVRLGAVGLQVLDGIVERLGRDRRGPAPTRGCYWSRA